MLVFRNPKTQLPMDAPVSQEYPNGLIMIDEDSASMQDGRLFMFEVPLTITAGATEEVLLITPTAEYGLTELRNVQVMSYQDTGISMIKVELIEGVTTATTDGNTTVFNCNRTDLRTANVQVHSDPATISGGVALPMTMMTVRSSTLISEISMRGDKPPIRLQESYKYSIKLTNTDASNSATVILNVMFIESV